MSVPRAVIRVYAELNRFLVPRLRGGDISVPIRHPAAVKDPIEAIGVPHTEVGLLLVDGESVGFLHRVTGGERITVYPYLHQFEVGMLSQVRPPQVEPRFALDAHFGKLARYLRLLGFDTIYRPDIADAELAALGRDEGRIVLSRDVGVLKRREVEVGAFVYDTDPRRQVEEVMRRFDLYDRTRPFTRCGLCNGLLQPLAAGEAATRVPPRIADWRSHFFECGDCRQVYWEGSHVGRLSAWMQDLFKKGRASCLPD